MKEWQDEMQDNPAVDEIAKTRLIRQIAYMVSEGTPGDIEEQNVPRDGNRSACVEREDTESI
jgi:hypothetical protein